MIGLVIKQTKENHVPTPRGHGLLLFLVGKGRLNSMLSQFY